MTSHMSRGLTETLLQGVAEATCLGVLTTDENLKITGWNHWLETQSGLPSSEDRIPGVSVEIVDVADGQAIEKLFGKIPELHILVNAAGVIRREDDTADRKARADAWPRPSHSSRTRREAI